MAITVADYARMSSGAYDHYQNTKQFFDLGTAVSGWRALNQRVGEFEPDQNGYLLDPGTDFAARVFQKQGGGNDYVISFRGTDSLDDAWYFPGFLIPSLLDQAREAEKLVQALLSENPNAKISFTGHSLGGGLAAMMAVRYDTEAVVFDPAPYGLVIDEAVRGALFDGGGFFDDAEALRRAESNIDVYQVEGEVLSGAPASLGYTAAQMAPIIGGHLSILFEPEDFPDLVRGPFPARTLEERPFDADGFFSSFLEILGFQQPVSRHSMDLLTLLEVRGYGNTGDRNLLDLLEALPGLTKGLIDKDIAGPVNEDGESDFTVLLRGLVYRDDFYANFYDALEKITKEGAIAELSERAVESVISLGFQVARDLVNELLQNSDDRLGEGIFGDNGNALFVNLNDITTEGPRAVEGLDAWISQNLIHYVEPDLKLKITPSEAFDGFVFQTNGDAALTVDVSGELKPEDKGAIVLGGIGNDHITGSGKRDILIGGDGGDTLIGGAGDDILQGGLSNGGADGDADYLDAGAGDDVVIADAGDTVAEGEEGDRLFWRENSHITTVTNQLRGGVKEGWAYEPNNPQFPDEPYLGRIGETYEIVGGDLIITLPGEADPITIENWEPGDYGIQTKPTLVTKLQTSVMYSG